MKTKRYICLSIVLCLGLAAFAQTQAGYVKTKGRMVNGKYYAGQRISNATIQVKDRTAVLSKKDGSFSFPTPNKRYTLQQVEKKGFVLLDQDVLYRQYDYSTNPLVLVMEDKAQLAADRKAIEIKIRSTTYSELQRRVEQLDAQLEQHKITEKRYRELLLQLNKDQDNNEKLIKDMVEEYNKLDFDLLDDFHRRVSDYIFSGRLREADSLLRTKGDIDERIEQYQQIKKANSEAQADLNRREEAEKKFFEEIAIDCNDWYLTYKTRHLYDSAAVFIEKRASLDTNNLDWLNDVGVFFFKYISDYDKSLSLFKKGLCRAIMLHGEENMWTALFNESIGDVYEEQANYDTALEYFAIALEILEKIYGGDDIEVALLNNKISGIYREQGDYVMAQKYLNKGINNLEKRDVFELHTTAKDIASIYNSWGVFYEHIGDYSKALAVFDSSLNYLEIIDIDSVDFAEVYNNIGSVYSSLGDHAKSFEYHTKAINIKKKAYGDNHPSLATAYNNIGTLYLKQGDYANANTYYSDAIDILIKTFGH